ncbi:hypothetical protein AB0J83_44240 [Actinoplanes sp. NPDC049596]|uniref:hypothetical protein n=1 Tax=unclassified Actinoplanes TaxID=2626549 RepID=UPI00342C17F5
MGRPGRVLTLAVASVLAVAACGDGDSGVALPSTRPSVTLDRTAEATRTAEAEPTRTLPPRATGPVETTDPEPTSTRTTTVQPEPTRTTEPVRTTEPTRTTEPVRTTEPARTTAPTRANQATTEATAQTATAAAQTPTATRTSESAAAVPASDDSDSGNLLAWFLLFLVVGGVIAAVLITRARKKGTWDTESTALTADTRALLDRGLPRVLATTTFADRRLAWPPVRDDLIALITRWESLAARAGDGPRQAASGQIALLLHDLIATIDDESAAQSAARDWRLLRPQVQAVLDALNAELAPTPPDPNAAPGAPPPGTTPDGQPGPDPATTAPPPGSGSRPGPPEEPPPPGRPGSEP